MPNDASGGRLPPSAWPARIAGRGLRRTSARPHHTTTAAITPRPTRPSGPCVGPRCHSRYFTAPPAVATMSMSGAFEARMSAAVVPRPARDSGVRASVAANSECVRLSKCGQPPAANIPACETRPSSRRRSLVAVLVPAPASAWGTDAHRYIMGRAIDLLPPELKPFFEHYRDGDRRPLGRSRHVAQHRLGRRSESLHRFRHEGARRVSVHGAAARVRRRARRNSAHATLESHRPAAVARGRRVRQPAARASKASPATAPYAPSDVVLFARSRRALHPGRAPAAFTRSVNYDGQLTGNNGIHSRFERDLFERFQSRLTVNPPRRRRRSATPRHRVRHRCSRATSSSIAILKADTEAIAGKDTYDDGYFEAFFAQGASGARAAPRPSRSPRRRA